MNLKLTALLFLIIAIILLFFYLLHLKKSRRRNKLFKFEFPENWVVILKEKFPLYNKLPDSLRKQLHGHINIFLNEKYFSGKNGIEINDTIRVVIAAQACILLLNRKTNYYPYLKTILVYPGAFKHAGKGQSEHHGNLGESWQKGPVVLSWQHSLHGGYKSKDGANVVMHEFAHQLDQEDGFADGKPILQHNNLKTWSKVLSREFNTLKVKKRLNKKNLLNFYGATNPAEFFAVTTEHFIEQPRQLKLRHSELYDELKKYYQIDPLSWS